MFFETFFNFCRINVCKIRINMKDDTLKEAMSLLIEKMKADIIGVVLEDLKQYLDNKEKKPQSTLPKEFYSVQEVAKATGMKVSGLKRLSKNGEIEMISTHNSTLMRKSEFDRYVKFLQCGAVKKTTQSINKIERKGNAA
jgi:hypothetical protein